MATNVANLVQGPGTIYAADFGATEPAETAVALLAAPAAPWKDLGGTTDGANLNISQEFAELLVDQVVDVPGRRLTKRDMSLSTNLAELTLENLSYGLNGGTVSVPVAGVQKYEPDTGTSATQPDYKAILLDCFAPAQRKRRIGLRRVLNTSGVEFAYQKENQSVYTVTWNIHYVSDSIRPFFILDENPEAVVTP
jgi:hypothetical protein